jgi:hypothetical protein
MIRGLPSLERLALVLLDFGPGLELRTRVAALRQHLRLLRPAREQIYRQEDLHEDAHASFI